MSGVAIGVDLGTSGVRAALVDQTGRALAIAAAAIPANRRPLPKALWDATQAAIAGLHHYANLGAVRCIVVAGTSGTILPVAAGGRPLAPVSLYYEPAEVDAVARVAASAPAGSVAHGVTSPLARALRWRNLPEILYVLHEADWLAGKLLGRFGATDWNNALKTGFDPVNLIWPDWISSVGLDPALLPIASAPGAVLGQLDPAVASMLLLAKTVQVAAGTTDGCAAFLATGAAALGDGVTSLGTTLTIKQLSAAPIANPTYGLYSHRIGKLWLTGGASNSGGQALARHFTPTQLADLSARIDPTVPTELNYYPLPAPGERFPIADANLPPRETPRPENDAAFLYGLLEGIARIEAMGYRRIAELGGPPLAAVYSVGGGAGNTTWAQIRARVLGVPLRAPASREPAVGVASLALPTALR